MIGYITLYLTAETYALTLMKDLLPIFGTLSDVRTSFYTDMMTSYAANKSTCMSEHRTAVTEQFRVGTNNVVGCFTSAYGDATRNLRQLYQASVNFFLRNAGPVNSRLAPCANSANLTLATSCVSRAVWNFSVSILARWI